MGGSCVSCVRRFLCGTRVLAARSSLRRSPPHGSALPRAAFASLRFARSVVGALASDLRCFRSTGLLEDAVLPVPSCGARLPLRRREERAATRAFQQKV